MSIRYEAQYAYGIPATPKPVIKRKRVCHDIIIRNGQIEHHGILTKYSIDTGPSEFRIRFNSSGIESVRIERVALFLVKYEIESDSKPINSEARNIVLGEFEEEPIPKKESKNMELFKAIDVLEQSLVELETDYGEFCDLGPLLAWNPYWADVFAGHKNCALIEREPQLIDLVPYRVGWVHPMLPERMCSNVKIRFDKIESSPNPIEVQFQIDILYC